MTRRRADASRPGVAPAAGPDPAAPATDPRLPIVFLHGTRLTGGQWAVQLTALGEEFACHTVDLPGHGTAADRSFSLDGAVRHVRAELDRLVGPRPAVLVGLSLGGYVAMALAAAHPERVAGLAISGATAEPVGLRSIGFRLLGWIFATVPEPVLDTVNRRFFRWRYPPEIAEPILAGGFWFAGGSIAVRSLVGERFRPRLAAYPGPSLLINGEFDLFFRPTERSFAAVAAAPRRARIPRASHLANLDRPDEFSLAIRRFARTIAGAPRGG